MEMPADAAVVCAAVGRTAGAVRGRTRGDGARRTVSGSPEARDPRLETALFWNSWMRLRVRFQEALTDNKQHVMA